MAAAAVKKDEIDAVSNQRNWEQRLTSEREIAKAWYQSWRSLYEGALTQQQQIETLEGKLDRWVRPNHFRWHALSRGGG